MAEKNTKIDKNPLIRFTDDFWIVLDKLAQVDSSEIAWSLYELDSNPQIRNVMRITDMDVSDKEGRFSVKIAGKYNDVRIVGFIKNYFGTQYSQDKIEKFIKNYNQIISGRTTSKRDDGSKIIEKTDFVYNPDDVRSTFLSLVTETYPHGHEEEVVKYLPNFLKRDSYGNYYHVIGDSDTSFTCHLDTASSKKSEIVLREVEKSGEVYIKSDGTTILGADDKAGVTVLLYMINKGVPGVYWFFIGEERGAVGSRAVAKTYDTYPFMKKIKKMVSFDRRNYFSVITYQMGGICCSEEFGQSLCDEMNKYDMKLTLDPTGVFTDSASFVDIIPECTNISVGYFDEHRTTEIQNLTYLEKLCKAASKCDWDKLVVKRKVGLDDDIQIKYKKLVQEARIMYMNNEVKISSEEGKLIFDIEVVDGFIEHFHDDMKKLEKLFMRHRQTPKITFIENRIKIKFN